MKSVFFALSTIIISSCQNRFITHSGEKGQYVEIDGRKLWVTQLGKGKPLFLIPGGPGCTHVYMHDLDSLKSSNLLVFIDFYGRGQSDTASDPASYSIAGDIEDIESIRKALGFEKINLLGHSFGSVIAQQYAAMHEDNVDHLIIIGGFYSSEMFQKGIENMERLLQKHPSKTWETLSYYKPEKQKKEYKDVRYPNGWNEKIYEQFVGADTAIKDIFGTPGDGSVKRFKKPVLIVAGKFDNISLLDYAMNYRQYYPQAKMVFFNQSGHNPQVEERWKVISKIKRFAK